MAITVGGTSITFNDGTTQTTAGGAPTTAQVLSATAGASVGAVGTYAFCFTSPVTTVAVGATIAGSSLRYASAIYGFSGMQNLPGSSAPSGTWRCMGYSVSGSGSCCTFVRGATLWLRIS